MKKIFKIYRRFLKKLNQKIQVFVLKLLGKKYIRIGKCKQCGRCCQHIYVRHSKNIIKTEEEFKNLRPQHFFYSYLEVIDKTETGLVFKCKMLNEEKGRCTAYKKRALICMQYPLEEIFMMGGTLSRDCGYRFVSLYKFKDILKKVQKKKSKCKIYVQDSSSDF